MSARAATLLLPFAVSSCVLGPPAHVAPNVAEGDYCASPHALNEQPSSPPNPEDAQAPEAQKRGYSARTLDTARAIGALAVVERLATAQSSNAPEAEIDDARLAVHEVISAASLDLSSAVAHIECEEGRAAQIASDLRDAEQAQTRRLTAYSLAISAAAAIASGTLVVADRDPVPGAVVGIGGGVAGGALGLATLTVHRTAMFTHARNALRQLWTGGEHPDFPESVWAYLTRARFTRHGGLPIREHLALDWRRSGRLGKQPDDVSPERVALYFGAGGIYDADGLDDRADMLSDAREAIGLMFHDLQHLETEASRR